MVPENACQKRGLRLLGVIALVVGWSWIVPFPGVSALSAASPRQPCSTSTTREAFPSISRRAATTTTESTHKVFSSSFISRRAWNKQVVAGLLTLSLSSSVLLLPKQEAMAKENTELPMALRSYTKLAPLGSAESSRTFKTRHLPLSEMAQRLERDLTQGATSQGGYILSGDLSTDLFRNDCVFVDPTNRVDSLSQYKKALTILFDPKRSEIQLLGPLLVNETERTIRGRFRSRGFLQLPWQPYVTAYESDITYKIDESDGLINEQLQTWSKSAFEALRESFTPTIFTPPPKSHLQVPADNEPPLVTTLFDMVNGRRPGEYSAQEQEEIRSLADAIVAQRVPWKSELFPGRWKLVYFEGTGVDRRIPFPEFGFNDQYQIFGGSSTKDNNSVTNIGQLFGPLAFVQVKGTYQEVDPSSTASPKRLQADITGGELCLGSEASPSCVNLPIQGVGLFESLYLGDRLRVLQNLNGTGARGIQVRMSF